MAPLPPRLLTMAISATDRQHSLPFTAAVFAWDEGSVAAYFLVLSVFASFNVHVGHAFCIILLSELTKKF